MSIGQGVPSWKASSLQRALTSWDSRAPTARPFNRQDMAFASPPVFLLGTISPFISDYFINHGISANLHEETYFYTKYILRNILQI